jgi:hypothetical protein
MVDRNVRWLVLDRQHLRVAPPVPPAFQASVRGFDAFVFHLPHGTQR